MLAHATTRPRLVNAPQIKPRLHTRVSRWRSSVQEAPVVKASRGRLHVHMQLD
jgi:hypothetical protein